MTDVKERDWKLFRKKLPDWQESYMEKLMVEYIKYLKKDIPASEKFWGIEKRIKKDKKNPGVLMTDISRSNFYFMLTSLIDYKVITMDDLVEFSDETQETVRMMARIK